MHRTAGTDPPADDLHETTPVQLSQPDDLPRSPTRIGSSAPPATISS
jgi:hypothetical protein